MTRPSSVVEPLPLLPALAAVLPVAIAFIALAAFVAGEVGGARPFAVAPAANVAEAVAFGDAAQALGFVRAGQDPNERWPIRRGLLDSSGEVHVTAIQAAMLARRPELVGLMMRNGARPDGPEPLACLAQAVDLAKELPSITFGVTESDYYHGPHVGGIEALTRCGFRTD